MSSSPPPPAVAPLQPIARAQASLSPSFSTPLTVDQQHVLEILTPITASLGILGAMSTILAFLAFRQLRTTTARVIFCMALADLIGITSKAIGRSGPQVGGALCQTQGALMQYGDLVSILWTAVVATNLVLVMLLNHAVSQLRRYETIYVLAAFLIPVPFAIVPLFLGSTDPATGAWRGMYGDSDLWCWIHPAYPVARLTLFYGPLWLIFAFNVITYALVGRRIWRMAAQVHARHGPNAAVHDRKYQYGKNTSLYLIAFVITWTPSTINRLYAFIYPTSPSFFLTVLMAICSPGRGFTNFCVYFYLTWFSLVKWDTTGGGGAAAARAAPVTGTVATTNVRQRDATCSESPDGAASDSSSPSSFLSSPNASRSDSDIDVESDQRRTQPHFDFAAQSFTPANADVNGNRARFTAAEMSQVTSPFGLPRTSFSNGGGVVFSPPLAEDDDFAAHAETIDLNVPESPRNASFVVAGAGHDVSANAVVPTGGGIGRRSSYNMRATNPR